MSLTDLTIAQACAGLREEKFTARALTEAHLAAIETLNPQLNAFITVTRDLALAQADEADRALKDGTAGALAGIPLAIKDLFCTAGVRTTAGSRILETFVPPYESTVTAKLRAAGAVFLGKANLDEFAMGSSNMTSAFGPVTNPWRRAGDEAALVPGGSSGGSAAAVAARLALGATGTDTGGSIRQPASFCGIVGMKPTYGRCSRYGIIAFASSLDQAGPMARTVEDCAILLGAMAGFDPKDSTSADRPVPDFAAACGEGVKRLKIGFVSGLPIPNMPGADADADVIARMLDDADKWLCRDDDGATRVDVTLPLLQHALPTYYIIAPAEASSNLARYDGVRFGRRADGADLIEMYERTRAEGFGDEVKRRILIGTYVLSAGYYDAYYLRAQKIRRLIYEDFRKAFETCDVIVLPTAPTVAFAQNEKIEDPRLMYLNDIYTVPVNLAGLPAISVPVTVTPDHAAGGGLPLGLQVIGRPFEEEKVFAVAAAIEKAAGFSARPALRAGAAR